MGDLATWIDTLFTFLMLILVIDMFRVNKKLDRELIERLKKGEVEARINIKNIDKIEKIERVEKIEKNMTNGK